MADTGERQWIKALAHDELAEGRVKPVTCARFTVCMTRFEGRYHALDNRCPHQGGPLGEGSIEQGWLRCPWHGWDFHPATGKPPGGFDDAAYLRRDGIAWRLDVAELLEHTPSRAPRVRW